MIKRCMDLPRKGKLMSINGHRWGGLELKYEAWIGREEGGEEGKRVVREGIWREIAETKSHLRIHMEA